MFYLGIDIGKNTHVASVMDASGKTVLKAFSFSNSIVGAQALLQRLNDSNIFPTVTKVGLEATGHYWLSVYSFLVEQGFSLHVINPIQTDSWRKGTHIRKHKTDIIDSLLIADLIRYGNFMETSFSSQDLIALRNLSRFRQYLADSVSDLKRKTICILDQVFPEYASVFSDIFGQTSKEILKNFTLVSDFENISSEQLDHVIAHISKKHFAVSKLNHICSLSKNSFGIKLALDSFYFQIKLLIEQIEFIQSQISDLESQMATILSKLDSPLLTIPGIGLVNGATILSEIGDIQRFSTPAKLVAYAGIDASVSQSGEYLRDSNHMSKRGSPYLRRAIFQAAFVASNVDPVFRAYYLKKRSEGKHHLTAIGAVARKLCYTIHAVLKLNTPYIVQNQPTE